MRTEKELAILICNDVAHKIENCGRNADDLSDIIDETMDWIMTKEESIAYPTINSLVKTSIIL